MPLKTGANHGTHYLVEELEFVDGIATVDVSDHDNVTVLLRGGSGEIRPSGWKVSLPLTGSTSAGDELCLQADLRGVESVDVAVSGDVTGVLYAGLTGTDF